jgi:hypothetical protein
MILLLAIRVPLVAQDIASLSEATRAPAFLIIGTAAEDRWRVDNVMGRAATSGFLLRAPSVLSDTTPLSWRELRFGIIQPYADVTWNSDLPFSLNDGVQWAGRGLTFTTSGGIAARLGRISVNLAPQIWRTENLSIFVRPPGDTSRRGFSNPWHIGNISADLPLRFGYHGSTAIDFGESAIWATGRGVAAGFSNESQWWGPGIRNALLMSNNAGGIPHAFVRTASPVRTPWGDVEGRFMIGGLTESRFFDVHKWNNLRSLSGAVVTFRPSGEPGLTVGLERVVYANVSDMFTLAQHSLDVLARWGQWGGIRVPKNRHGAEQISGLFGRWIFPTSGAEVYGEWARLIGPSSLRSLLVAPQYSQGFTVGVQWVTPHPELPWYRLQVEFTNLEQSPTSRSADTVSFYTSAAVPQGYTQRGQIIGASIGPGSQSQWGALDRLARRYDVGVFVGRIRWDTDAYYLQSTSIYYQSYDASIFAGARASIRAFGREISTEYWIQRRYNYLFQNELDGYSQNPTFDKRNVTLRLKVN